MMWCSKVWVSVKTEVCTNVASRNWKVVSGQWKQLQCKCGQWLWPVKILRFVPVSKGWIMKPPTVGSHKTAAITFFILGLISGIICTYYILDRGKSEFLHIYSISFLMYNIKYRLHPLHRRKIQFQSKKILFFFFQYEFQIYIDLSYLFCM